MFTKIFYRKNYDKENEITKNVGVNVGVNSTQRKILELIEENQSITQKEILQRIGTDKAGYWKIIK